MKITIEPSSDQSDQEYPHNIVSVESPHDDITIKEAMELTAKVLQAWGFHNENIAEYLEEEFAWELGLKKEEPYKSTYAPKKGEYEENWHSENDKTNECGGI